MLQSYVLSLFLYFPKDKSEYIPASITFVIFAVAAVLTMRLIVKVSNKEAEKAKEFEAELEKKMAQPKQKS
ncbi:hypothetical protein [Mesobacillus zeae]|uniref:Uncharacterized protein n=1 Tax=Mesobacillus zeae TaxID=1917180 RepID=A0A398BNI4_9BACI|nr:hypothetical protein [Mesobacillus zeae]RID88916.1 hypothetical protein D1970_00960 [Mesobacillus zeae]